jgi:hypothetical protein
MLTGKRQNNGQEMRAYKREGSFPLPLGYSSRYTYANTHALYKCFFSLSRSLVSLGPTLAAMNYINQQVLKPEMLEEKMIKDHFHRASSLFFFRYWYRYGYSHRYGLSLNRHSTTSTSKPKSKKQKRKKKGREIPQPPIYKPHQTPKGKQGEERNGGKGEFFENCGLLFFIGNKGS